MQADLIHIQYEFIELKLTRDATEDKLLARQKVMETQTKQKAQVLHDEFRVLVGLEQR
jgi:hypothetical protein